jgi:protein-S-isoprenylcysteine O-methyltransferase Ste14
MTMVGSGKPTDETATSWRWDNVPLPEPHVAGVLFSAALYLARPWRLPGSRRLYSGVGWTLVGAGVALSAWAVRAASDADLERPSALVSTGPYARSRNPMYVGWTLLYLGAALITRNSWMLFSLPLVGGVIHREVLREEHALEGAFRKEYFRYRKQVRRYV